MEQLSSKITCYSCDSSIDLALDFAKVDDDSISELFLRFAGVEGRPGRRDNGSMQFRQKSLDCNELLSLPRFLDVSQQFEPLVHVLFELLVQNVRLQIPEGLITEPFVDVILENVTRFSALCGHYKLMK